METLKSTKVDWKKLTVVGALVILTGLTVGLITWYIMDDLSTRQAEDYQGQISTLESNNNQLQEDYKACNEVMTVTEEELDVATEGAADSTNNTADTDTESGTE